MTTYAKKTCWLIGAIFLLYFRSDWNYPTSHSANSIFDHRLFLLIKRRPESSSLDSDPKFFIGNTF